MICVLVAAELPLLEHDSILEVVPHTGVSDLQVRCLHPHWLSSEVASRCICLHVPRPQGTLSAQSTAAAAVAAAPVPARAPSRKCGFIHEGGVRCECTDSLIRVRADSYDTMATIWRIKGIADVSSFRLRPSCWSGTNAAFMQFRAESGMDKAFRFCGVHALKADCDAFEACVVD